MNKRPGTKKTLAIFLAMIMMAQTGVMAAAEEISATIEDDEPLTVTATIKKSTTENGENAASEKLIAGSDAVVVSEEVSDDSETAGEAEVSVGSNASGGLQAVSVSGSFDGAGAAGDGNVLTWAEADPDNYIIFDMGESVQLTGFNIVPKNEYGVPPAEFKIISNKDVEVLEWFGGFESEGADNLFDSNTETKWCHASDWSYVIWEMPEEVSIDGYQLVTANDNADYHGRNPKSWTLWGANDYDSDEDTTWVEIDSVSDNQVMKDENYTAYNFYAGSQPAYKYYQIEFGGTDSGTFQLSGLNLLNIKDDGGMTREEGVTQDERDWAQEVSGIKIQGSTDGEEWITLYRFNEGYAQPGEYYIDASEMGSVVNEYTFKQFRVINDSRALKLAEIEFFGEANAVLEQFPTQDELTEPIYSYVDAMQLLEWDDLGDGNYVWNDAEDNPHYLFRDYENPVMIIGAALPSNATVDVDTIDGREVIGFAPYAFENEDDLETLYLDDNITYVYTRALADCYNLETIYVGSALRVIEWDALIWATSLTSIIMNEEVTDADTREGYYPIVDQDCLIVNGMLVRYASAEPREELVLSEAVHTIGARVFGSAEIEKIICPNVEWVSYTGFSGCTASEIVFSPVLAELPNEAFFYCDNLTSLTVPRNLISVADQSFDDENGWTFGGDLFCTYSEDLDCEITDTAQPLTIHTYDGNTLTDYINDRQDNGDLSNVTIEPLENIIWTVYEIGEDEYIIKGLAAPEGIQIAELPTEVDGKTIVGISGEFGFDIQANYRIGDENGHLVIPEGYKYLWYSTFRDCGQLKSVELPSTLEEIDKWAFSGTSISKIEIPENCNKIFEGAFRDCPNLTKVTINSQASEFNENSVDSPYNDIFDMDENTGKTVPVIEVYKNSGAHSIGLRSRWNMTSLGVLDAAGEDLLNTQASWFGSDPMEDEDAVYQNASDGDPDTYFHTAHYIGNVGIELEEPVQITEVNVIPYAPNNPGITVHESAGGNNEETADLLFDYRKNTKWCVNKAENIKEIYVVFSLPEAESINGYQIVTANDMEDYPGRNPKSWTLYGSNDYDPDMLSGGTWMVLDSVQDDEILQDINYEPYEYSVENADAYKYYKLVIHETKGSEIFQMADFNLVYDGCSDYETLEEARRFVDGMEGIKLQGSVDGENWITIYRIPWDNRLPMNGYRISGDIMSNVAHEYTFTYFRLTNDTRDLIVADVEFYGEPRDDLAVFPQMDEIAEPIYSYVDYDVILQYSAYNFDDNGYLWDEEGLDLTVSKEFEHPVMLVGAMFPTDFEGDWTIPDTVSDGETTCEIIGIAPFAFYHNDQLQHVVFGDNIRYVCEQAFAWVFKLQTVTINRGLRCVSDYAFSGSMNLEAFIRSGDPLTDKEIDRQCGRYVDAYDGFLYSGNTMTIFPRLKNNGESYTIPDFIETIGFGAMNASTVISVDLGDSVRKLESFSFEESDITSLEIPASVEYIGRMIGLGCDNLESIYLYPANLTEIADYAFDTDYDGNYPTLYVYEGSVTEQTLIDLGYEYQYIESDAPIYSTYEAEDGIHLEHVTHCGFTDFVIPEGVTIVDRGAFDPVENITSVTFPKTLVEVQGGTFAGRDAFTVNWGGAVPVQYVGAFDFEVGDQYDETVYADGFLYLLDADTETAAVEAYWYGAIDEEGTLTVPSSVTWDGVTYDVIAIMSEALMDKAVWERMIPFADENDFLTDLDEDRLIESVPINELILPDSIIYIGRDAFSHRDDMTTVKLPRNVVFMEPNFSFNNWNLTAVTGLDEYGAEYGGRYQLDGNMIINTYGDDMLTFYPMANEDTVVEIAQGVQRIRYEAFNNNDFIEEVRIPLSVYDIQDGAFMGCDNITDFVFPDGSEHFELHEDGSIRRDENGERLVAYPYGRIPEDGILELSDDISFISPDVFHMATNLTELIIPASCRHIDDWAIVDNPNLRSVQIYGNLEDQLNLNAFANNQNLGCIDYFGEKLELYWYEFDKFPIRIATDVYGNEQWNEDGTPVYGEKVILTIADENCEPVLFTMRGDDWENEDNCNYETYSIDNNPYITMVYGDDPVYFIHYEANGGHYAPATQHKLTGETILITEEEAVSYDGLAFLGWSTDPMADEPEYEGGEEYSTDEDLTLYAVWEVGDVIYGDVNNDGEVTSLDRLILSRFLANWAGYEERILNETAADVNRDGKITNKDRMILARYLAKWEGYENLPMDIPDTAES